MDDSKPETEMIRILQKEAEEDFAAQRLKSGFRFTGEQVKFITYMMDKYGDDFKVIFQELWFDAILYTVLFISLHTIQNQKFKNKLRPPGMTFCEIAMTYLQVNQTWTVFSFLTNTTDIIEYFPVKKPFFQFQGMAKDPKNHYQETPKQIRQKILKFINIPEQFAPYAKEKGLLETIEVKE